MKKIITIALAFVFCIALSVTAFAAEYTVGADGNAVYDSAIGYEFGIDDINGKIEGEDATICTTTEALDNCGVWAIWFTAEKVSANIYVATTDGAGMGGSKPAVTLNDGQIVVVIHSSTSNPDQADQYPNWEDKVAALAIKKGDYMHFEGVDIAAGTVTDGKMTCMTKEDAEKIEDISVAPAESSEPVSEPVSDPASQASSEAAGTSAPASEAASTAASSSVTSEMETDGSSFPTWAWIVIGVAVVAIIAVVVVKVGKKK